MYIYIYVYIYTVKVLKSDCKVDTNMRVGPEDGEFTF